MILTKPLFPDNLPISELDGHYHRIQPYTHEPPDQT